MIDHGRRERATAPLNEVTDDVTTVAADAGITDQQFINYVRDGLSVSRLCRLLECQVTAIEARAAALGVYDDLIEDPCDDYWRARSVKYCDAELSALRRAHPDGRYPNMGTHRPHPPTNPPLLKYAA